MFLYRSTVAILIWVFLTITAPEQGRVVSARAGLVQHVKGEVILHCHNGNETGLLKPGVRLCDDDLVLTTADAAVEWSLTPDSYLKVSANSLVRAHKTELGQMDFDVERGEVVLIIKSLSDGATLALHTPPARLRVNKAGSYLIRVLETQETEAVVAEGEIQYVNKEGKEEKVKQGRKVFFHKNPN